MGLQLVGRAADLARAEQHLEPRGGTVALFGAAGVGKTRLARELLGRAAARGAATMEVRPNSASATVAFAAFVDLLPPELPGGPDPTALLQACLQRVRELVAARPLALLIDDAHLLDPGGLALLPLLAEVDGLRLILTVRSDGPVPEPLTALWKDGVAERQDVAPLERPDAIALAEELLGGRVGPGSAGLLWELSKGNPLALTELIHGAHHNQQLVRHGDGWHLTGRPAPSGRLGDIIDVRLTGLTPTADTGVAVLALVGPLGYVPLSRLIGTRAIDALEAGGLVEVRDDGRRHRVHLTHPMIGEVVRRRLGRARQQALASELLEVFGGLGSRRRGDALRLVSLVELSGQAAAPGELLAGARDALGLGAPVRAEELAHEAVDLGAGVDALLVVGEARSFGRRAEEAEQVLDEARRSASTPREHAQVALARFHNQLFNLGDPDAAERAIEAAAAEVAGSEWSGELDAALAMLALLQGDLRTAVAAGQPVRDRAGVVPRTLLSVLVVSTAAHTMLGDLALARADLDRALGLIPSCRSVLPLAEHQIGITEVLVHWHDGRVEEAVTLARQRLDHADRQHAAPQWGAWATALAIVLAESGRIREARALAEEAAAALGRGDALGLHGTALAVAARSAAVTGDLERAEELLGQAASTGPDLRTQTHVARARTWLLASRGEIDVAVALAVETGQARSEDFVVWGAMLLHDAVRFGHPVAVVDPLAARADEHDAGLLGIYRDHARALLDRDVDRLLDVAARFGSSGFELYEAEVRGQIRDLLGQRGRAADRQRTAARDGLLTPALVQAPEPLTPRERQVALMARLGLSSKEIADRLVLSPRTVDNHLASVYAKLGVRGRRNLATALTDPDPDPPLGREPAH